MEPVSSLPYSQAPATCPYPVSIQSLPPLPTSWRFILILSSHLCLGLANGLFPSGFPTKTLCTPLPSSIHATCPAHLILLDFITRTILGEEYRSLSSSVCNFLHSPVIKRLHILSDNAYEQFDFCTVEENIYRSMAAINQPLTGANRRGRGRCVDWWCTEHRLGLRNMRNGYVKRNQ